MDKFIVRTVTFSIIAVLLAAVFGVQNNRHLRPLYMPSDIRYEIVLSDNVWPDRYYSNTYDMPEPRSLYFNGYWTFEPAKYPFSGPVWVYHTNELTLKEANYTVNQVTR